MGGASIGFGRTCEGALEVEGALLRMDEVDGYCLRPALAAALPACFDAPAPMPGQTMTMGRRVAMK